MHIKYQDQPIELEDGSTGLDLVEKLGLKEPHQAVGFSINRRMCDISTPLKNGDVIEIYDFDCDEGREIFWHTSAHVLAQAILRLWPDAQPTIGPPIENGFYYDFAHLNISEEDFPKIEKEIKSILKERFRTKKITFSSKEEALEAFKDNPYKVELINSFDPSSSLTAYQQGEFTDLCRGPHLMNLGKIKAFKLMKTSGAYWRGNSENEMLTRIYGISFPDKELLNHYLTLLEEAKKRDHRVLGNKLDLFSFKEDGPGMPFIHPSGMIIWNKLLEFWRELHQMQDYVEIKTPIMLSQELWERSGHWFHYRENMYTSEIDERSFAIKPMNCPGGMLYYKSHRHSYREFPLRVGEIGLVHRHELSGSINGLLRVRSFHQDDAHIFMTPKQIKDEIVNVIRLADTIYKTFGLDYRFELSTRPEKSKTIGSDEDWDIATNGLRDALIEWGSPFQVNEGDGAFYGPKIDLHVRDALGRSWQCGTIQLDMSLPERFDLEYTDSDGQAKRPIMIHRALYGSIERFFAILIEHFAGRFPLWLSPRQICFIPVADRHVTYAKHLASTLKSHGLICDVDDSNESVSKKIRNAQMLQFNYMLTIGDQEIESKAINIRTRENIQVGAMSLESFISQIKEELQTKSLVSLFQETSHKTDLIKK
ncbi:MAG: threonine--tRNA ligase [Simkaniaceae bacterium]|nr:threonine--tRNA ligase [Simkaniaceae bacterium]